nr:MATE family efflux transporter [uncultured Eisenbergiella sp.]
MQQSISAKITLASLLAFTLPTIIANVFMSIYTTVDGIFVANLVGTQALSAVNIVMPFLMVTIAIGTMLGTGGSALVAKKLGEGKTEEARRNFSLLVIVCFVTSALLSALGLLFKEPVLTLLGADESIYYYCEAYASPLFVIIPFAMLGIVFQMFFIADGKPHYGMAFSIAGGLMNILLDYLLIAKAGMGIRGAAIATGIGYAFPAVIGLFYFTFKRTGNLYFVKPRLDKTVILKAGANGSSEMVTMLSTSIVTIAMNNIMIRLAGADGVSAITILLYAQTLLSSVYMGYATGIAPITSFNFGKGDTDNLKKIHRISLRTIAAASVITFLASFFLAKPIIQVFARAGTSVYNMAMNGFLIFAVGFLFMGFNVYSSSMFTALNNGKVSAILSFFRTLVFLLAALLIFPAVWNVTGVWIAMPAAEALSILMTIYYFRKMGPVYNYA